MKNDLIAYLFGTRAIRVCPKNVPFWYTSGKIGPYYVNTHFLYGSEDQANQFLEKIDALKDDKAGCSDPIFHTALEQYGNDPVYRGTLDSLTDYIRENLDPEAFDYVSGGERRDWFFSFLVADHFKKPHITLFKDLDAYVYENGKSQPVHDLKGAKVLHVADLITTASSYERAWVPALQKLGGEIKWSLVVVDRLQGGGEVLSNLNVESHALIGIDRKVFEKALESGYINEDQLKMVLDYMEDPEESMRRFLMSHPDFITGALDNGGKAAERAKLLIENNFYRLKAM